MYRFSPICHPGLTVWLREGPFHVRGGTFRGSALLQVPFTLKLFFLWNQEEVERGRHGWDAHEIQKASGFGPCMLFTAVTVAPQGSLNTKGGEAAWSYKAHGGTTKESSYPGTQARMGHGTNSLPGSHTGLSKNWGFHQHKHFTRYSTPKNQRKKRQDYHSQQ